MTEKAAELQDLNGQLQAAADPWNTAKTQCRDAS